jgi:hypothetical protein
MCNEYHDFDAEWLQQQNDALIRVLTLQLNHPGLSAEEACAVPVARGLATIEIEHKHGLNVPVVCFGG